MQVGYSSSRYMFINHRPVVGKSVKWNNAENPFVKRNSNNNKTNTHVFTFMPWEIEREKNQLKTKSV